MAHIIESQLFRTVSEYNWDPLALGDQQSCVSGGSSYIIVDLTIPSIGSSGGGGIFGKQADGEIAYCPFRFSSLLCIRKTGAPENISIRFNFQELCNEISM